jgi:hypothetical protein
MAYCEHHRESWDTLEYWLCMPLTSLSDDHVKSASSIYQQLELAVAHSSSASAPSSLLLQASITK